MHPSVPGLALVVFEGLRLALQTTRGYQGGGSLAVHEVKPCPAAYCPSCPECPVCPACPGVDWREAWPILAGAILLGFLAGVLVARLVPARGPTLELETYYPASPARRGDGLVH